MKLNTMNLGLIRNYRDRIESSLQQFITQKTQVYSNLSPIHKRFYYNLVRFINRGGKRLRPILLLLGHEAVNGHSTGDIFKASCAVELLHTSTLIHDDLVDKDEMRRGGPTFHIAYRNQSLSEMNYDRAIDVSSAMGILGGNIAWNLGLDALLESGFPSDRTNNAVKIYANIFSQLINGVMLEESMSASFNSNEDDYIRMISLKTSTLISNSLKMGAELGNGSSKNLETLERYGNLVGQAFQIRDDILGTFGERKHTGKPADSDILWGKKTLLVLYAMQNATSSQEISLTSILGDRKATERQVDLVRTILQDTGALSYCQEKSKGLVDDALKTLDDAKEVLDSKIIKILRWIATYSIERTK